MDENLDNELKNRIKEVFDNFEDSSADEGWLQLRKKFPEEQANRRAFAWMWWSAAAVLLLFMSISLWMFIRKDQTEKFSGKSNKHPQSESVASVTKHNDTSIGTKPGQVANPAIVNAGKIAVTQSNKPERASANKKYAAIIRANNLASNNKAGKTSNSARKTDSTNKKVNTQPGPQLAANNAKSAAVPVAIVKPETKVDQSSAQQLAVAGQVANSTQAPFVTKPAKPAKSINDMFVSDQKPKTMDKTYEKVRFGVYAATYVNYSKGSDKQFNAGVGFTSDISINKNLKFVTGVSIAQNSLTFENGVPTSSSQTSFTVPGASQAFSTYSLNAAAVTVANVPVLKNYNADMVSLDIPLNLKYEFNAKKSNVYILAGVSSGTFINETYTYQYNYPALLSPSLQQLQDQTSHSSFSSFYFAKTLNLAIGVGYPVGKNRLELEPFLKYPLDGLGAQNIRFGAGGINLKFNFQSTKK